MCICECSERDQLVIKGFGELDSSHTRFPSFGKRLIYIQVNTHTFLINLHLIEKKIN